MDPILMFMVLYLLVQIVMIWPTNWQTKVLLLALLLVLVLLGFFGASSWWPHQGSPARIR